MGGALGSRKAANEQKRSKFADLVEECREAGEPSQAPWRRHGEASSGPQPSACSTMWDTQEQSVRKPPKMWWRRQKGQLLAVAVKKARSLGPSDTEGISRG